MKLFGRRQFFGSASALSAWAPGAAAQSRPAQPARADRDQVRRRKPYIAIQVDAVSFMHEGTEKVLDISRSTPASTRSG